MSRKLDPALGRRFESRRGKAKSQIPRMSPRQAKSVGESHTFFFLLGRGTG